MLVLYYSLFLINYSKVGHVCIVCILMHLWSVGAHRLEYSIQLREELHRYACAEQHPTV